METPEVQKLLARENLGCVWGRMSAFLEAEIQQSDTDSVDTENSTID